MKSTAKSCTCRQCKCHKGSQSAQEDRRHADRVVRRDAKVALRKNAEDAVISTTISADRAA